jgi:hypothetical protein
MLTLHIEANSIPELIKKGTDALGLMFDGPQPTTAVETPPEKKRPGRPRKEEPVQPSSEIQGPLAPTSIPVPSVPAPAPTPSTPISFDQVRASLQRLAAPRGNESGDIGMKRVADLISGYKTAEGQAVRKLKELQANDYAAVHQQAEMKNAELK